MIPTSGTSRLTWLVRLLLPVLACALAAGAGESPGRTNEETLNACLQLPLFSTVNLWSESAEQVAKRLHLSLGSQTREGAIWRASRPRAFGVEIAEIRLLAEASGKVSAIELNLLNKGDYFTPMAMARKAREMYADDPRALERARTHPQWLEKNLRRQFNRDCEAWEKRVQTSLDPLLGNAKTQRYGSARRHRMRRWDSHGTAFLLDSRANEFVLLRLVPVEDAEARGRSAHRSDRSVKTMIAANVRHNKRGDVWIDNIPMVDQGAKGYCAVATAERLLRYYGIAVDSHDLADAARTARGGGTTWSGMCAAVEQTASRHQRRFRTVGGTISIRGVSRYIDKGIPLFWGMYVTPALEQRAADRAGEREHADAATWKRRLKKERAATRRLEPDKSGAHVRLIVGYNKNTREIATSDSWGRQRITWITESEARRVSFSGTCMATVVP